MQVAFILVYSRCICAVLWLSWNLYKKPFVNLRIHAYMHSCMHTHSHIYSHLYKYILHQQQSRRFNHARQVAAGRLYKYLILYLCIRIFFLSLFLSMPDANFTTARCQRSAYTFHTFPIAEGVSVWDQMAVGRTENVVRGSRKRYPRFGLVHTVWL